MSCVLGVVHDGKIYMGCDSIYCGSGGSDNTTSNKLFRKGEFLIGSTYSIRARQLLAYSLEIPELPAEDADLEKYIAIDFVNAVRACLKAGGMDKKEDGLERGGYILVGIRGRLFTIEYDYDVMEPRCGYWAIGSDNGIPLGVLAALTHLPPEERIRTALEVAERHSIYIRAPFIIERGDGVLTA